MKKTSKRFLAILLALFCLCGSAVSAGALDTELPDSIEEQRYTGAYLVYPSISVSTTGTATCSYSIQLYSGYTASTTLRLQRSSNNSTWSTLASWSGTDGVLKKNRSVSSGYYYRTQVSTKVYSSSGKLVDSITKSTSSVHY